MYILKVSKEVTRKLKSLPNNERQSLKKQILELEINPRIGKHIDTDKKSELWELKFQSHRIYYTIENKFLVINNITYEGSVAVNKFGNKNTQKKDIKKLKKGLFR